MSSPAAWPPDTPAGAQAYWLVTATAHPPISTAELRAHFDASFLAQHNPAQINQAFLELGGVAAVPVSVSQPRRLIATVMAGGPGPNLLMTIEVDARGLISGLEFGSALPVLPPSTPTTWPGVDAAIRSVAPQVRLLAAEVAGGSCRPVHSIDPGTTAPLGSAFKLYVLDALATAIAAGKVNWTQSMASSATMSSPSPTRCSTMAPKAAW